MSKERKCNFCKKEIKKGETFLQLYGQYKRTMSNEEYDKLDRFENEPLIKIDNIRPFWVLCEKCRHFIINHAHDEKHIIVLTY